MYGVNSLLFLSLCNASMVCTCTSCTLWILHVYLYVHVQTFIYTCMVHIYEHSKKQQLDDMKTVERNRRELVRLDQQLKVSKGQYTRARELNHELSQRLEEEKALIGDKEYRWKVYPCTSKSSNAMYC